MLRVLTPVQLTVCKVTAYSKRRREAEQAAAEAQELADKQLAEVRPVTSWIGVWIVL